LKEVIDKNVKKIDKDMLVTDIFNLIYDSPTPLAVVENDRLIGVVIRGSVIEALAETDSAAQAEEGVVTNG
jgi:glycine betaine/proline transport system ATP-binding protein